MKWSNLQRVRAWAWLPLSGLVLLSAQASPAADRIILRSLNIVTDRSIVAFDEDGVRLDDGSTLGWHQIDRARVARKQSEFNALLKELGADLFRLNERLEVGDYQGLLPPAEALYPRFKKRRSLTSYTVAQSLMWARLESADREGALEPYLRCLAMLKRRGELAAQLPGRRRVKLDPQTGLTEELLPIFFDSQRARQALPGVFQAMAAMPQPRPPGALVYCAALALTAGETKTADRLLRAMRFKQNKLIELKEILAAQRKLMAGDPAGVTAQLSARWRKLSADNKPLALYWLGRARLAGTADGSHQSGLLDLLSIAANYGDEHPELAAAALFQTMTTLRDAGQALESVAVRGELLSRYGQTYFGSQANSQPSADSP